MRFEIDFIQKEFEERRENFAKSLKAADAKKQELYTESSAVNTESCHPWHVNCTQNHGLVYNTSGQDATGKTFCDLKAEGKNVTGRLIHFFNWHIKFIKS